MTLVEPSWHDARQAAYACVASLPIERVSRRTEAGRIDSDRMRSQGAVVLADQPTF